MFKKFLSGTFAAVLLILFLPLTISADPFKDIEITDGTTAVEADWFDSGTGNSYDADPQDAAHDSRPGEAPQTQVTAGYSGRDGVDPANNYCLTDIQSGEWVQYTVKVQKDGNYDFRAWLSASSDVTSPGGVELYYDGDTNKIGYSGDPYPNGWQIYSEYLVGTWNMTAGTHVIKALFPYGGCNYNCYNNCCRSYNNTYNPSAVA